MSLAAEHLESAASAPRAHRFSVAEYYRLGETGILPDTLRTELIEGEILEMPPIGSLHADWVDRIAECFFLGKPEGVRVRVQNPVHLDDYNEPVPDLALLRPRARPYAEAHPAAADTLLVVEVADSTLCYDRKTKVPLYARLGVPEVWLFDIRGGQLEIYRGPQGALYRQVLRPRADERITPLLAPELAIDLATLFGAGRSV